MALDGVSDTVATFFSYVRVLDKIITCYCDYKVSHAIFQSLYVKQRKSLLAIINMAFIFRLCVSVLHSPCDYESLNSVFV